MTENQQSDTGRGALESVASEIVPPMVRSDFRLPQDLRDRARADAEEQGIDYSEYVRQSIAVRLAWSAAVKAIKAGANPDEMLDVDTVVQRLTGGPRK